MHGPWLDLPGLGAIRISTIVAAAVMAGVILWRRRSLSLAVVAIFGWASAYEIVFTALGTALHGWSPGYLLWLTAALAGWVVVAAVMGVVPDRWLLVATAAAAVVWVSSGFHVNSPNASAGRFSEPNEVLNELTKTLLAAAYLAGALRARSTRS